MGVLRSQCADLVAIGSHQGCAAVETDTCVCDCRNFTEPAQQHSRQSASLSIWILCLVALHSGAAQAASGLLQACSLPAAAHMILPASQKQLKPTAQQGCREISLMRVLLPVAKAAVKTLPSSAARGHLLQRAWHTSMRPQTGGNVPPQLMCTAGAWTDR